MNLNLSVEDLKLFENVMENVKKIFVNEGIDMNVAKLLEESWMKKLEQHSTESSRDITQIDGSSETDTCSDSEPSADDEEEEDIQDELLNSDDDIEDTDADMVTDNVIFCKYTNVKRVGRKWSLSLTSGVMQLNGKHSVFGEAQVETWF